MTQEPVAYLDERSGLIYNVTTHPERYTPLYKKREWVGLTDEELAEFSYAELGAYDLCLEVEAKLKERNHG